MATVSANRSAAAFTEAAHRQTLFGSEGKIGRVFGPRVIKFSRELTAAETADFDGAGDFLEFGTFPPNCYLVCGTVTVPSMDEGVDAVTLDVMAGSTVLVDDSTAGQAGGDIVIDNLGLVDVSGEVFKLKIEDAPNDPEESYASAFTARLLVFLGAPTTV